MLLLNAAYLFETAPYLEIVDGIPDYLNVVALLILSILQASFSAWIADANQRYYNGMAFDCLLGLCFVCNLGYTLYIGTRPVVLRIKRAQWRCKNKAAMKKKLLMQKSKGSENSKMKFISSLLTPE